MFTSKDSHCIIFVTRDWLFKDINLKAAEDAALNKTVTLIILTVVEAHLICKWQSFQCNYRDLETIMNHFFSTSVMFLTATAIPSMTEKLKKYLSDPTVLKGTMNSTNITLDVQDVTDKSYVLNENCGSYISFVNSVCKIIKKDTNNLDLFYSRYCSYHPRRWIRWALHLLTIVVNWMQNLICHRTGNEQMAKCR